MQRARAGGAIARAHEADGIEQLRVVMRADDGLLRFRIVAKARDQVAKLDLAPRRIVHEFLPLDFPAGLLHLLHDVLARLVQRHRLGGARPQVHLRLHIGESAVAGEKLPDLGDRFFRRALFPKPTVRRGRGEGRARSADGGVPPAGGGGRGGRQPASTARERNATSRPRNDIPTSLLRAQPDYIQNPLQIVQAVIFDLDAAALFARLHGDVSGEMLLEAVLHVQDRGRERRRPRFAAGRARGPGLALVLKMIGHQSSPWRARCGPAASPCPR